MRVITKDHTANRLRLVLYDYLYPAHRIYHYYAHSTDFRTLTITYCDLRGRIKAAARNLIPRIVDAFNMTNIKRSIKEL